VVVTICLDGTRAIGARQEESQAQAAASFGLLLAQDGLYPHVASAEKTEATDTVAAAEKGERQGLRGAVGRRSGGGVRTGASAAGRDALGASEVTTRWVAEADSETLGDALIEIREAGIDPLEAVFASGLRRFDKCGE
jgi:hypothetical protein